MACFRTIWLWPRAVPASVRDCLVPGLTGNKVTGVTALDFGFPVSPASSSFRFWRPRGLFVLRGDGLARKYTLAAALIELVLALPLTAFHFGADFQFVERLSWVPQWGLHYSLAVDGISILMVWLTLFTLPLCVLCSWTGIVKRTKEFHFCLLIMTSACIGVFTAMDLVLFYVFWEAMLIPMYLLIAVWGGDERKYASIKFFLYTLAGSTLLLVAIVAFRIEGGTFSIPELMQKSFGFKFQCWCFLAMALAFAIKCRCSPSTPGCRRPMCRPPRPVR